MCPPGTATTDIRVRPGFNFFFRLFRFRREGYMSPGEDAPRRAQVIDFLGLLEVEYG